MPLGAVIKLLWGVLGFRDIGFRVIGFRVIGFRVIGFRGALGVLAPAWAWACQALGLLASPPGSRHPRKAPGSRTLQVPLAPVPAPQLQEP